MKNGMHTDRYGTEKWYKNDRLHRDDGPANEWAGGMKEWYLNGKRYREDGPAIEYADGTKSWYLNGEKVTMEDVITDPKEQFWWNLKSK